MKRWVPSVALMVVLLFAPSLKAGEGKPELPPGYEPSYGVIYSGFSGLLDLPTSDTLQKGKFSIGAFYRNIDRELSDVDVNHAYAVVGVGLSDRVELGFSIMPVMQTDYDNIESGRFSNDYPWAVPTIEDGTGDLRFGLKYRFVDFGAPGTGLAAGVSMKFGTGSTNKGLGTGGEDLDLALIGSQRMGNAVQLTGDFGFTYMGDAEQASTQSTIDLANELHYGVGAAFPARGFLRGIVEFSGVHYINEQVFSVIDNQEFGQEEHNDLTVGLKLHSKGFGVATGYKRLLGADDQMVDNGEGLTFALTFTDWDRPVTQPPPPDQPKPEVNYPPTAKVRPERLEAFLNEAVRFDSDVTDPNEDALAYGWTAPQGQLTGQGPTVVFTPPKNQEGTYTVNLQVSDGKGGTAADSATLTIKEDPLKPYWMEGLLFELDEYELKPEALPLLDMLVAHLKKYPNLKLRIEGHTCNLYTEEYNLALGHMRATSIKNYMVQAGIDPSRLSTLSYGPDKPAASNAEEETRRLNRRGSFRLSIAE